LDAQIAASRRRLFGNSGEPPSPEICAAYMLPKRVPIAPCIRNKRGELVIDPNYRSRPILIPRKGQPDNLTELVSL
jgi:hypothetical protein